LRQADSAFAVVYRAAQPQDVLTFVGSVPKGKGQLPKRRYGTQYGD